MMIQISDLDRLALPGEDGKSFMGSDQEWFRTTWQRMAGCGPSVASNLLLYQNRAGKVSLPIMVKDKESQIQLMEYAWQHITPGMRGVNKTSMFYEGLDKILEENGSELRHRALDVPKSKTTRPPIETTAEFINAALLADSPLAFLNLESGQVDNLDDWHWMTATALEQAEDGHYMLSLYDNGVPQIIDLNLWLETTRLGGGFVYLG